MLTRWSDFGLGRRDAGLGSFDELRREVDRLFRGFEQDWAEPRTARAGFWPRIALQDKGEQLELRLEAPGFKQEDVQVTLERDSLTIRGERTIEPPEGYSVHRQERGRLRFARSLTLPCRVDGEHVQAKLEHGVLQITLPKAAEEKPKQIEVRA